MAASPDLFESPAKRHKGSYPPMPEDDGHYRVSVGQTLVLYNGHVLTANYSGIPVIVPGTGLCKISRNIAAGPYAYIFIQVEKTDKFSVLINGPGTDSLIFTPFS